MKDKRPKIIVLTLCMIVASLSSLDSQTKYTIIEQKGKIGLANSDYEVVISARYNYVGKVNYPLVIVGMGSFQLDENNKLSDVLSKSRFGVFNLKLKKEVVKCKYNWISVENTNTIVVFRGEFDTEDGIDKLFTSDNGFGLFNSKGERLTKCKYYYIDNRVDNAIILADFACQKKDKSLQVIVSGGKIEVEALMPNLNKKSEIAHLPEYQIIDNNGRFISNSRFTFIGPFANGLAVACKMPFSECSLYDRVVEFNGSKAKFGYIDTLGNISIPFQFDKAQTFYKGKASVKKDGKEFYIDVNGIEIK